MSRKEFAFQYITESNQPATLVRKGSDCPTILRKERVMVAYRRPTVA